MPEYDPNQEQEYGEQTPENLQKKGPQPRTPGMGPGSDWSAWKRREQQRNKPQPKPEPDPEDIPPWERKKKYPFWPFVVVCVIVLLSLVAFRAWRTSSNQKFSFTPEEQQKLAQYKARNKAKRIAELPDRFRDSLRELMNFKGDPEFHDLLFSRAGRFNAWYEKTGDIVGEPELQKYVQERTGHMPVDIFDVARCLAKGRGMCRDLKKVAIMNTLLREMDLGVYQQHTIPQPIRCSQGSIAAAKKDNFAAIFLTDYELLMDMIRQKDWPAVTSLQRQGRIIQLPEARQVTVIDISGNTYTIRPRGSTSRYYTNSGWVECW